MNSSAKPKNNNVHYLKGFIEFHGVTVREPVTRQDYLRLCSRFLTKTDYKKILKGIVDEKTYRTLDKNLKIIVDHYYNYYS